MTTDNRTNEPTDEQVEAAAATIAVEDLIRWRKTWGDLSEGTKQDFRSIARAALVAAQEAAPQAESEELAWYKRAAKHSADSMAEARATLQMFADRVDPFVFDELSSVLDDQPLDYETGDVIGGAAPVLPPSGLGEDALAEVIESHVLGEPNGGTASWAWVNCSCGHRIEIAGVTREHVVALGRKHQARAVVAYLRGES